jgi:hypothetical protein
MRIKHTRIKHTPTYRVTLPRYSCRGRQLAIECVR